jgi:hypothetical protein
MQYNFKTEFNYAISRIHRAVETIDYSWINDVCDNIRPKGKYNYSSLRVSRVSKKKYVFENKYTEGSHIYTYKSDSSFHID